MTTSKNEAAQKVLVFVVDPKNISVAAKYLEPRNFVFEIQTNIQLLAPKIQKFAPTIVLVSLNIESDVVMEIYKIITHLTKDAQFWYIVEFINSRVEVRLSKVEQNLVIMPPINGPNLYRKLSAKGSTQKETWQDRQAKDRETIFVTSKEKEKKHSLKLTNQTPLKPGEIGVHGAKFHFPQLGKNELPALRHSFTRMDTEHLAAQNLRALSQVVKSAGVDRVSHKLESVSRLATMRVATSDLKGFVVAAISSEVVFDQNLFDTMRKRLANYLNIQGENVDSTDFHEVSIDGVEFIAWSEAQADFLQVTDHRGVEIAVAFFRDSETQSEFIESMDREMVSVSLNDVKPGHPAPVDLFLHMPVNQRFFRYIKKGQSILSNQWPRLASAGKNELHIRKTDVADFKKDQADRFLKKSVKKRA